jgi:hypothetical protein
MREWLKRTLTNRWMNDATVLAQIGHFLGAYSVILAVTFLTDKMWPTLITAFGMAVYAPLKEHWTQDTRARRVLAHSRARRDSKTRQAAS